MLDFLSIDATTVDTNLIFLGLIVSLWIGVTAAYVPGTGLLEGIALIGLGAVLVIFMQMEVRWPAVLLLVLGVSVFSLVPFIDPKYAQWALSGLVLQAVGSTILFQNEMVHPMVIILMLVLPFAYYQFILLPMLENIRKQPTTGKDDLLIGSEGRVTKDIDPIGTIYVNSESWTATSNQRLRVGTPVKVVDREGLRLIVVGVKEKRREEFATSDATD